jgi:SAM-dependent methyltransferase
MPSVNPPERNRTAYASEEAVETYTEHAVTDGLFASEEKVLDRHFPAGASVLDVGCGVGRTTVELHRRGYDVLGVDVSEAMVEAARSTFPHLDVAVADATALPHDDERFEHALFSYCGIDYVYPESQRLAALRELRRVLAPGGRLAFSSHNCLYNLPALVDDWGHLKNTYVDNGNWRKLFSPYKTDGREYDVEMHVTHPVGEWLELRRAGFEFVEFVGKRDSPLQYLERRPYYVARKPTDA